ncbi:hypothetical protein BAU15_03090 [Enterococcus sp. JM4C]|uniref:helix-turn-helix transcriptional regulator n=1 Tax=Candidatus Enterococcus huntleyi TaxID=1857217 RepID=UPI001379E3D3|nr:AraC family transcriptional regulator [Enterococcus sp. JM4C]KAF1295544.1 hypothetical protein BAU15_03090 [Enterococcus sp. JM4C]
MKELLLSFLPEQFEFPEIFRIELAGITYPFADYRVERAHSQIYSIEYVIAGTGELQIDGESYYPQAGDTYILPKNHHHKYWSDKRRPFHKVWINVSGTLCDHLFDVYHLQQRYVLSSVSVREHLESIIQLCQDYSLSPKERSEQTSLLFFKLLMAIHQQARPEELIPEAIQKAKSILDNHLHTTLSINELARQVNLSASQLTRVFKSIYQQTPYDYFLTKKMEMAEVLLVETRLSIQEISDRLAFSDEHYFSNLFKQKRQRTPSSLRK